MHSLHWWLLTVESKSLQSKQRWLQTLIFNSQSLLGKIIPKFLNLTLIFLLSSELNIKLGPKILNLLFATNCTPFNLKYSKLSIILISKFFNPKLASIFSDKFKLLSSLGGKVKTSVGHSIPFGSKGII